MIKTKMDWNTKKMTEYQMVSILKEVEAGIPVKKFCQKYTISNTTFYK